MFIYPKTINYNVQNKIAYIINLHEYLCISLTFQILKFKWMKKSKKLSRGFEIII